MYEAMLGICLINIHPDILLTTYMYIAEVQFKSRSIVIPHNPPRVISGVFGGGGGYPEPPPPTPTLAISNL